jgi:hypothetical protein
MSLKEKLRTPAWRACRIAAATALIIVWSGCSGPVVQTAKTYRATFEVSSSAPSLNITVVEPVAGTVGPTAVSIFPWSYQFSDSINFQNPKNISITASGSVPANGTITVSLYYEEVLDFPPGNNRRLVRTQTVTNDAGAAMTKTAGFTELMPWQGF